jgi:hypothetical protein
MRARFEIPTPIATKSTAKAATNAIRVFLPNLCTFSGFPAARVGSSGAAIGS